MTILISGGAGSGKSAFAERLAVQLARKNENRLPDESRLSDGNRLLYIATMEPYGEEAAARIAKHRKQRRGLGFVTVERYRDLAGLDFSRLDSSGLAVPRDGVILLEDLGNLCANELFHTDGQSVLQAENSASRAVNAAAQVENAVSRAENAVLFGLEHLRTSCRHVVVVTNEVFSGGGDWAGDTDAWLRLLARVNRKTAALSDGVCEVVCGVPCWMRDPWRQEAGVCEEARVCGL